MSQRKVRLDCDHIIWTNGDRVQPVTVGALRWCGVCWRSGWRKIKEVLS